MYKIFSKFTQDHKIISALIIISVLLGSYVANCKYKDSKCEWEHTLISKRKIEYKNAREFVKEMNSVINEFSLPCSDESVDSAIMYFYPNDTVVGFYKKRDSTYCHLELTKKKIIDVLRSNKLQMPSLHTNENKTNRAKQLKFISMSIDTNEYPLYNIAEENGITWFNYGDPHAKGYDPYKNFLFNGDTIVQIWHGF